jgi:organic radical activating enzyme
MDSPTAAANLEAAITYCTDNPHWRLSLQSHKMIGIR